jgi:hypothetical protein
MTDETTRADRNPADEPDGTPAYTASLRPPGASVDPGPGGDTGDDDDFGDDGPDGDGGTGGRAGYDVDAVAGDTEAYRPE